MGVSPVLACRCNACRTVSIKAKLNLHKLKKIVLGTKHWDLTVQWHQTASPFVVCKIPKYENVLKMHTLHAASYNYTRNIDDKVLFRHWNQVVRWKWFGWKWCYPAPLSFLGRIRFKLCGQVAGSFWIFKGNLCLMNTADKLESSLRQYLMSSIKFGLWNGLRNNNIPNKWHIRVRDAK